MVSYNDWVDYCFGRHMGDPPEYDEIEREEPSPERVAIYLATLFEQADALTRRYSPDQVGQGLRFICGTGSSYFHTARDTSVAVELQIRWVRALRNLYSSVFEKECANYFGHLDSGPEAANSLNAVCYMFWDMDCLEGAAMFPGSEHLVDPIFEVLAHALASPNPACVESALHGLGHLQHYHPHRVEGMIDGFLKDRSDPVELIAYAQAARTGCVN